MPACDWLNDIWLVGVLLIYREPAAQGDQECAASPAPAQEVDRDTGGQAAQGPDSQVRLITTIIDESFERSVLHSSYNTVYYFFIIVY